MQIRLLTLALKPRGDVTRSPKQGISGPTKRTYVLQEIFFKNKTKKPPGQVHPFYIGNRKTVNTFNRDASIVAELGDYDEGEHTPGFISEFRFVPESKQTEDLELAILEAYKLRR